jgi:dTMP kinase
MRGKLITLYGINNIGKSTQARLLIEKLKDAGADAVYVKYPVYDVEPTGPFINKVLRGSGGDQKISEAELQMWFCLNRHQFQEKIEEYLAEGKIVVAEDYTGTGIAWGESKGLKRDWLEKLNENLLKEDIAILLEGKRHMSAKESGHVHEENTELVERCRNVHEELADKYGWIRFQINGGIEESSNALWELINLHLK